MEITKLIKKAISVACLCFTIITAVYMLIMQITNVDSTVPVLVEGEKVLLFFVFSLLYAIANAILSLKALHSALRYIFHFITCVFGFYACFLLPADMSDSHIITGIILFILGYLMVMGVRALFRSRLKSNREAEVKYEKQFKKSK